MRPPLQVKLLEGELYDIDELHQQDHPKSQGTSQNHWGYIYIYLRYLFTYLLLSLSHIGSTGLTVGGCCLLLVTCTLWAPLCPRCHVGECLKDATVGIWCCRAEGENRSSGSEQDIGIGPDQGWFTMNSRKFMGTEQAIFIYWLATHESVYIYRT